LTACGGRTFPEAQESVDYVQYLADPQSGFREYRDGLDFLAQKYSNYLDVFTLRSHYDDPLAVSAGFDKKRSTDPADSGDGNDVVVAKLTDESVPDEGKQALFFSLSVHGDERGGLEGGVRALEDLLIATTNDGTISDGIAGFTSTTGKTPEFHTYKVADVLKEEIVYFVDFNIDGWTAGERNRNFNGIKQADPTKSSVSAPFHTRGNAIGTDLNRQMPTVGFIDTTRNPLEEPEMLYGHRFMHEVAANSLGGKMAYGADVHGEAQSRAYVDIMYPAGQFDSVKHRQHMSIAQRTKSEIDDSLYLGLADMIEEQTGGDAGEGIEDKVITPQGPVPFPSQTPGGTFSQISDLPVSPPQNTIPTKPARWGTVWDTLGYTDTGFIGDYLAGELGVTGMDYEIFMNHSDATRGYGRPWTVVLQENYINATRAIVKTAMAYAMTQEEEFADFQLETGGRVGYLDNPDTTSDGDEDGIGTLAGPQHNGKSRNGKDVTQNSYSATNMRFFEDESKYVPGGITKVSAADIADDSSALDGLDTLVLADVTTPLDAEGNDYDPAVYFANLKSWVERGGNLVLTDRALHVLGDTGIIPPAEIKDINVYQPYANVVDFDHPMVEGLRGNARQLSEATLVGYGIGNNASPMTIVTKAAWEAAGGHTVATTGNNAGSSDSGTQTSVGQIPVGLGQVRIMGGGLPMPTEINDHRYGLKDYALTYSGLYIMENSMKYDSPTLGQESTELPSGIFSLFTLLPLGAGIFMRRKK
jgi:hypothetical protein